MIGAQLTPDTEITTDLVQPFQLELANVRGRAVRLGGVLDEILSRHDYPHEVEQLVAETVIATVLLASLLKYDGVFTLQAKGDGPVPLLVADVTSAGDVRAYAKFDPDRLQAGVASEGHGLLGSGYLAFTVDQPASEERYQGIVALVGGNLTRSLAHYFEQSEQLPTAVKLAARCVGDGWRAGAVLLQPLPEDDAGRVQRTGPEDEENWRRATILLDSVADVELLDRTLHLNNLLFRLFHEERVRVFTAGQISRACRCSAERVQHVLRSLPRAELEELKLDGVVVVTCDFCSEAYRFDDAALERLFASVH